MTKDSRPYVICHMIATLDGRVSGDAFYTEEMKPVMRQSWRIREEYDCKGVLCGTVTAAEIYADGWADSIPEPDSSRPEPDSSRLEPDSSRPEPDHLAGTELNRYAIAIDPEGRLNWIGNVVERPVQPLSHVIVAVTGTTPADYLRRLQRLGISYITAGERTPDFPLMMEKLKDLFAIDRLLACGGGETNWSLLQAGCLDELSLVTAPVTDGRRDTATVFDRAPFARENIPQSFLLRQVSRLPGGGLWQRFLIGQGQPLLLRDVTGEDMDFVLSLNRENVEVLSPMDADRFRYSRENSGMFRIAEMNGEPAAFLIALREGLADYGSENYRWFSRQYEHFLYVDRIVIDEAFRGYNLGRRLYEEVFQRASDENLPRVTAEIDIEPYNEASLKFHEAMGFEEVGRQVIRGGEIRVSLQSRPIRK